MIKQEYLELKSFKWNYILFPEATVTQNNIGSFDWNGKENERLFQKPIAKLSILMYLVAMPTKQFNRWAEA